MRPFVSTRTSALPLLLAAVALLSGCPQNNGSERVVVTLEDDSTGAGPEDVKDIIEMAKREGELWWYTSLPEEEASAFLDRFEQEHPYLTTHLVRASTFDTIQRVKTEIEQGNVGADVIHVLDVAIFSELRKSGKLLRYDTTQQRAIPARYKQSGYWWALRLVGLCIAYDSSRFTARDVPDTWPELLEDRWAGRIALKDAQTAGSAYAHYYFLRDEYGISYWNRMAKHRPRIYKTAAESLNALEQREVDLVSGMMGYSVSERQKEGSSVAAVWPKDGVPMMLGPVAILRGAPHRNAAKLFVDIALSRQGQTALRDLAGVYSGRDDVEPPEGRPALSSLKLMVPTIGWDEYAQKQETFQEEYTGIFHPGSE